jgi:hypothetical protein
VVAFQKYDVAGIVGAFLTNVGDQSQLVGFELKEDIRLFQDRNIIGHGFSPHKKHSIKLQKLIGRVW